MAKDANKEAAKTAKDAESGNAPLLAGAVGALGAVPAASGVVFAPPCPACIPVKSVPVGAEPAEVAEEVPAVIIRSSSVRVEVLVSIVDCGEESEGFSVLVASSDEESVEGVSEDGSATEVVLVSSILVIRGVFLPSVVE